MFTSNMAPLKDFAFSVRAILLLTCILAKCFLDSSVDLTCNPPEDFTELHICKDAIHTGWSFYVDTLSVLQNNTGVCKCSVNISQTVQDVQVSYNYQGPNASCDGGFKFNLANLTLACNATASTVAAKDIGEIEFRKDTTGPTEPACLLIYFDRNLDLATITCFESTALSTPANNVTIPITSDTVVTSINNTTASATLSSTQSPSSTTVKVSTRLSSSTGTQAVRMSSTTHIGLTSTIEPEKFNEIIVIAVVAGVGGFLLILVLIVICITCCRSTHSAAKYDVKRKQLDSTSTSDIDLTENAFYNVALVNSPNYYG